jgi:hypothetical protein
MKRKSYEEAGLSPPNENEKSSKKTTGQRGQTGSRGQPQAKKAKTGSGEESDISLLSIHIKPQLRDSRCDIISPQHARS